jgi:signal peptidase I
MTQSTLKQIWKKEYAQTAIMIAAIIIVVLALWFGTQAVLGTQYPALAVASGSMCTVEHMNCDGWSHPFERTLHKGDLIIVQAVDPKSISDAYPNSDIIVFHKSQSYPNSVDELIVHRVIHKEERNGLVFFRTKGDGNGVNWPADPGTGSDSWSDYRGENYTQDGMISENMLVGKVILRIPWIGHLALFMRESSGIYLIIAFIILLVILEFALPVFKGKKPETETKENVEKPSET